MKFHIQSFCDPLQNRYGRVSRSLLQLTDICLVDPCTFCQFLLRHIPVNPRRTDGFGKILNRMLIGSFPGNLASVIQLLLPGFPLSSCSFLPSQTPFSLTYQPPIHVSDTIRPWVDGPERSKYRHSPLTRAHPVFMPLFRSI